LTCLRHIQFPNLLPEVKCVLYKISFEALSKPWDRVLGVTNRDMMLRKGRFGNTIRWNEVLIATLVTKHGEMRDMVLSKSDKATIQKMIEKALDEKLAPVERDVAHIEGEIDRIKGELDALDIRTR
jgi:hypothetical protein